MQIEAYRIGDSLPAPRFNVASKPDKWIKQATEGRRRVEGAPTEFKQRWTSHWSGLGTVAGNRLPALLERAGSAANWQQITSVATGRDPNSSFSLVASRGGLRVELCIDGILEGGFQVAGSRERRHA